MLHRLLLVLVASITIGLSIQNSLEYDEPAHNTCVDTCGEPGNPSRMLSNKTYVLNFFAKANWYQALHLCHSINMKFASVNSQQENDMLVDMIKQANVGRESFWLSGSNLGSEDKYIWTSYGLPVNYTNWFTGEPSRSNRDGEVEHCIEISSVFGNKMNDEICSVKKFYVCEYQNNH